MKTTTITLQLDTGVKNELDYLVRLHMNHGAPNRFQSVERLLEYVASVVADGSRRPGAWERSLLEMMGLVPDSPVASEYRATYGEPHPK